MDLTKSSESMTDAIRQDLKNGLVNRPTILIEEVEKMDVNKNTFQTEMVQKMYSMNYNSGDGSLY